MVLNYIWIAFFLIAFVVASIRYFFMGDMDIFPTLVNATMKDSQVAFEIALGLTGIMTLWLGIMKIGEKAGVVKGLSILFGPFIRRIFPEVPRNHPVIVPIFMKFSMNVLGLDNAGTPLGIKAMKELQTLNPSEDTASNAQIMFAVLNTTGMTLIPVTVLGFRAQLGASNPADVFIPIMLSTTITALSALILVSIYQKINLFNKVILIYLGAIITFIVGIILLFTVVIPPEKISEVSGAASNFILFSIIILFIVLALIKKINVYSAFIEGAKEGFEVAIKIVPYLLGILVGIGVFREVGGIEMIMIVLEGFFDYLGILGEFVKALPVALLKPLSGGGAQGMMVEILKYYEPDSFMGTLASIFQGTTDTTLYVLAVYFGAVGIRNTRYAATCGLIADIIGLTSAIFIAYIFFSHA